MREGTGVLTEQTLSFINDNPSDIIFTRRTKQDDGAGGTIYSDPAPTSPQHVRVLPQSRVVSVERRTVSGEMVTPDMNLVAMPDADIRRGDTFPYQGLNVEVVWINDLGYELICEVAVR